MAGLFHHDSATPLREREAARATEDRAPRSLLASPWFWAGGVLSLVIWIALYTLVVR